MRVKLINGGLYGTTTNHEPGDVLDLPEDLARDVALRGDGLLMVKKGGQVVPAFGAIDYPSIEDEGDEPPAEATPAKPAPIKPAPIKPAPAE